jgi:hypothetical protein
VSTPFERQLPPGSGPHSTDVFIFLSNDLSPEWTANAYRIAAEAGMVPIYYKGLQRNHHGSNISNEAQADLWECDAIVVAITSEEADEPAGLWIHDQLDVASRRDIPICIYVWSPQAGASRSRSFGNVAGVTLKNVTDDREFAAVLREDLKAVRRA